MFSAHWIRPLTFHIVRRGRADICPTGQFAHPRIVTDLRFILKATWAPSAGAGGICFEADIRRIVSGVPQDQAI
jgi:hypothetical protein